MQHLIFWDKVMQGTHQEDSSLPWHDIRKLEDYLREDLGIQQGTLIVRHRPLALSCASVPGRLTPPRPPPVRAVFLVVCWLCALGCAAAGLVSMLLAVHWVCR